jgi:hypothetical protein
MTMKSCVQVLKTASLRNAGKDYLGPFPRPCASRRYVHRAALCEFPNYMTFYVPALYKCGMFLMYWIDKTIIVHLYIRNLDLMAIFESAESHILCQ